GGRPRRAEGQPRRPAVPDPGRDPARGADRRDLVPYVQRAVRARTAQLRHELEDAAEVAEAERGVEALRHRGRLEAGGAAAARPRVVEQARGQRAAEPAAAGVLERPDVVD